MRKQFIATSGTLKAPGGSMAPRPTLFSRWTTEFAFVFVGAGVPRGSELPGMAPGELLEQKEQFFGTVSTTFGVNMSKFPKAFSMNSSHSMLGKSLTRQRLADTSA